MASRYFQFCFCIFSRKSFTCSSKFFVIITCGVLLFFIFFNFIFVGFRFFCIFINFFFVGFRYFQKKFNFFRVPTSIFCSLYAYTVERTLLVPISMEFWAFDPFFQVSASTHSTYSFVSLVPCKVYVKITCGFSLFSISFSNLSFWVFVIFRKKFNLFSFVRVYSWKNSACFHFNGVLSSPFASDHLFHQVAASTFMFPCMYVWFFFKKKFKKLCTYMFLEL